MLWNPKVSPPETRIDAVGGSLTSLRDWLEPAFMIPIFLLALYGLFRVPRRFAVLAVRCSRTSGRWRCSSSARPVTGCRGTSSPRCSRAPPLGRSRRPPAGTAFAEGGTVILLGDLRRTLRDPLTSAFLATLLISLIRAPQQPALTLHAGATSVA